MDAAQFSQISSATLRAPVAPERASIEEWLVQWMTEQRPEVTVQKTLRCDRRKLSILDEAAFAGSRKVVVVGSLPTTGVIVEGGEDVTVQSNNNNNNNG